ncbi:MAG: hypothetical protein GVY35_05095 [Bacteroidetes bacterium]|nr:hypothetical protein [Bacteroidota bacterium]
MKRITLIVISLLIFAGCDSSPTGPEDATLTLTLELGDHDYNDALVESRMKGFMKVAHAEPSRDGSESIRRVLTDYEIMRGEAGVNNITFRTSVKPTEGRIQIMLYDGETGEVFQYAETERVISVREDVSIEYDEVFTFEPSVITASLSREGVFTTLTYKTQEYDSSSPYLYKTLRSSKDINELANGTNDINGGDEDDIIFGDYLVYSYNGFGSEDNEMTSIPEEGNRLADSGINEYGQLGVAEFPIDPPPSEQYRPYIFPDSLSGRFRFDIKDSWRTEEGEGPRYVYYPNLGADPVIRTAHDTPDEISR